MTVTEARVFELREVTQTAERVLRGVAVPYNTPAPIAGQYIETIAPGAFAKSIKEAAKGLPLFVSHKHDQWPVGRSVAWEDTPTELIGTWEFTTSAEADEARGMVLDGTVSGLSVGFQPLRSDWNPGSDTEPPSVVRREARLFETSITPIPQYAAAQIMLVRTAGIEMSRPHADQWRRWLEAQR